MEVLVAGEVLPDECRADNMPVTFDQTALRLVRKQNLGDACHRQRINQAGDERERDEDDDGWADFA